ncbi:MAG: restriction endonuclease [bacterium]|nr:restriction endonuclease [bacterium]
MALPKFDDVTLVFLQFLADGQVHTRAEYFDAIAKHFQLSEVERNAVSKSGMNLFRDRCYWARYYLLRALLVEKVSNGKYRITTRGLELLKEKPTKINAKLLLEKYEEFREFYLKSHAEKSITGTENASPIAIPIMELTPTEQLTQVEETLRQELLEKLREAILKNTPSFFEQLVVRLLEKMGYGIGEITGKSGDGGIDGIIYEDKLGLEKIHIQAKRFENAPVGRPTIQGFVGALVGLGADKGVFITMSHFSQDAANYVKGLKAQRVILIDGEKLLQLMIDHELGVSVDRIIKINKIDNDFFEPDE